MKVELNKFDYQKLKLMTLFFLENAVHNRNILFFFLDLQE